MAFRRVLAVLLAHLAVLICFPNYAEGVGISFIITSFAIWVGIIIVLSVISSILFLDRWEKFNAFLSAILFFVCLFILLNSMPQENRISPLQQLAYGDFPTVENMKKGADKLMSTVKGVAGGVQNAQKASQKMYKGSSEAIDDLEKI